MQTSFWEKESFFAPNDIVIAGSGFVGLWSAYYLKKKYPKRRITVIDRGSIPYGASTRNAGFACFGSVTELMQDSAAMGENTMLELVEQRYAGLSRIQKVFGKKTIDFAVTGGYELITGISKRRMEELQQQVSWLNKRLSPVLPTRHTFEFANHKIRKFGFSGVEHLIRTRLEGYLHPGKLCQLLLQTVQSMGVHVLTSVAVTGYEKTNDGLHILTDKGVSLFTRQLLVCTNAFAKQLLPELDITPARGQVLITAPIPSLKIKGTFHYEEGFYYFRNVGNRLLLGGARNTALEQETTTVMDTSPNIQEALESFLSAYLLPDTPYTITDRWSGIMAMGPEKMPVVREITPGIFCAVRMSGMGVALAPVVAEKIAVMMG